VPLKRFIQLLISVILLAVLVYWIDFENFAISIKSANYLYIFVAFVIVTFNRCIMAYKWNLLLRVKGINISFFEVYENLLHFEFFRVVFAAHRRR
jgi:uncharacterized membrane protein YbhN (UPF0104 family)